MADVLGRSSHWDYVGQRLLQIEQKIGGRQRRFRAPATKLYSIISYLINSPRGDFFALRYRMKALRKQEGGKRPV